MVIVLGRVLVKQEHLHEAFALGREHSARSRAEPGCLAHNVHVDAEQPHLMVFVEKWADRAALEAHFRVPASRAFVKAVRAMAQEPPQIDVHDEATGDMDVRAFFDEFVEAFATFEGRVIAQRYVPPYLAFHSKDSSKVFRSNEEIAEYFQEVVDGYRGRGCRSCRYRDLEAVAVGKDCALASVTWELLAADGSVVTSWRESYNLCVVDGRYRVFASVDHA